MVITRGTVYEYTPVLPPRPRQSTKRLILTVDRLNVPEAGASCVGLLVDDEDQGGLLNVSLGAQGWWVSPVRIERVLLSRLGEALYRATPDELDQLGAAMRAAYDL